MGFPLARAEAAPLPAPPLPLPRPRLVGLGCWIAVSVMVEVPFKYVLVGDLQRAKEIDVRNEWYQSETGERGKGMVGE